MGTCLMCHRKIPNGQKFCDSCKQKRKNKADESYLDSLLNSVGVKVSSKKDMVPEIIDDFEENPEELLNGIPEGYQEDQNMQQFEGFDVNQGYQQPEGFDVNPEVQQFENPDMMQNAGMEETAGIEQYGEGMADAGTETGSGEEPGVDDILSDLLDNIDENALQEEQVEPEFGEDDLENIFDEAEAYANSMNSEASASENDQTGSDLFEQGREFDIPDDSMTNEQQPDLISNDLDSFFTEVGEDPEEGFNAAQPLDNPSIVSEEGGEQINLPEDEVLNEVDKSLQGENSEQISVSQAFDNFDPIEESISVPQKKKKKKLSWFKRLFGNVNDEVTPEMLEADKLQKEEKERLEAEKKEEKKKKDEEKKAEAEAEKARKKAEADAERNRKMALAAEKKAAAKEKARKKQETALAIAEFEMEHGKINKAGATILFVIFAVLTIVIIIGTNIYSYNLSIENARQDFEEKKYNEAYYEVYGLKIQDEDIELYDRIMTVMYVNTQLNSYEYYMKGSNREKALDSLLKGLQRYDKYLELARKLDITDDLNYVKSGILERLDSEFGLSEEEAYDMVSIEEDVDYSEYLYGLLGSYEDELEKYKRGAAE